MSYHVANFREPMAMLQLPIHYASILKSGVHHFRHRFFMCYHFQLVFRTFFFSHNAVVKSEALFYQESFWRFLPTC